MDFTRRDAMVGAAALGLAGPLSAALSPRTLSDPKATAEARALYSYLWSIYGRKTLTGQQESPGKVRDELPYIQRTTGRQPALLGLDYIDPGEWAGIQERSIAWHRAGGLVTICWHWGAPDIGTGYESTGWTICYGCWAGPGRTSIRPTIRGKIRIKPAGSVGSPPCTRRR